MPDAGATVLLDKEIAEREQLYAFLHLLQRGDLALGASDFARVDRVLFLLRARGIGWNESRAAKWFAPVLCGTASEQALFHERFREFISNRQKDTETKAPFDLAVGDFKESVDDELSVPKSGVSRWVIKGFWALATMALIVAGYYYLTPGQDAELPLRGSTGISLSISFSSLVLTLIPLLLATAFVRWHRSRQLMLLRAFTPSPERVERVAFAAALPSFYSSPQFKRALGAMRRHWSAPGGRLNVKRSVRATLRAGGRPELQYGARPRTPEYVLLVDRETPQDHLSAIASLLVEHFVEQHIIVTRYHFYGDPRRVVHTPHTGAAVQHSWLEDIAALHPNSTVLLLAESSVFFDKRGALKQWADDLKEWSRPVLLSPRDSEHWDWREHRLEQEDILVFPATSEGLQAFSGRLKLGPIPLLPDKAVSDGVRDDSHRAKRPRSTAVAPRSIDLVDFLNTERTIVLDDKEPRPSVVAELIADLQLVLGARTFALLQALAVFPKLEPALSLHIGTHLRWKSGPLLDEQVFLSIARLPWLRVGYIPNWLRQALVQRLEKERLAEILRLIEGFLQPIADQRTGAVTLELARRDDGKFRQFLLHWIKEDSTGELDDRILVDALRAGIQSNWAFQFQLH
jgi:hypothetical protein